MLVRSMFSSSLLIFTYFSFEIKFVEKKVCFDSTLHTLFVLSYRVTRPGLASCERRGERERDYLSHIYSREQRGYNVQRGDGAVPKWTTNFQPPLGAPYAVYKKRRQSYKRKLVFNSLTLFDFN